MLTRCLPQMYLEVDAASADLHGRFASAAAVHTPCVLAAAAEHIHFAAAAAAAAVLLLLNQHAQRTALQVLSCQLLARLLTLVAAS